MAGRVHSFLDEFREVDAILLEFAYDEWEKPWHLPQYRPLLSRVLQSHSCHDQGDVFVELVDSERAKLALEPAAEQPEQPKIAAARKPSLMKRSKPTKK